MTQVPFSSLDLHASLLKNLRSLNYHHMTPVQAQSLPAILAGNDVIAQAKTGSGKTAAFGLGILNKLDVKKFRVQTLVLCPTRELADQVATEIRKLARTIHNIKVLTLCGGMPFGAQIASLEHGAHILVGTPGRIEDHINKGRIDFTHLTTLVLDEADRMLDMGFQPALDAIIEKMPGGRQTLLYSATYPAQIDSIAQQIMQQPVMIKVVSAHAESSIKQQFYNVANDEERLLALKLLLLSNRPASSIVFCNTKRETQQLAEVLSHCGFSVAALHGDLEQRDRDQTLVRFANHSVSVLVATDVAARGLDISALDLVINYHISRDPEVHVHRIGRTGRAGSTGIACSLYSDKEGYHLGLLEDYLDTTIQSEPLPSQSYLDAAMFVPEMATIQIDGGKKQKVRAGDIVGALTATKTINGDQVGKIHLADNVSYVAVKRAILKQAVKLLSNGKLKGRSFRARHLL